MIAPCLLDVLSPATRKFLTSLPVPSPTTDGFDKVVVLDALGGLDAWPIVAEPASN